MKALCTLGLVGALLLGVGCSSVQTAKPFPANPEHPDREKLSGVWQSGDGFLHVSFATNGAGRFAIPEWKSDDFEVERGDFTVATGAHGSYFTALMKGENEKQLGWSLGEYRINDGALIIWWANAELFAAAVGSGTLKGAVTTNNGQRVVLETSPEDLLKFLDARKDAALFDYRNPGVFHKIAK